MVMAMVMTIVCMFVSMLSESPSCHFLFFCIFQVLSQQQVSCNQKTTKSCFQVCWFSLNVLFIISSNSRSFISEKKEPTASYYFCGKVKKRNTQTCKIWRKHFNVISLASCHESFYFYCKREVSQGRFFVLDLKVKDFMQCSWTKRNFIQCSIDNFALKSGLKSSQLKIQW